MNNQIRAQRPPPPSPGAVLAMKLPFYVRIGFGLLILFGMVGSCSGNVEGSVLVFVTTVVVWASIRIVAEAFYASQLLRQLDAQLEQAKKDRDRDDDGGPPGPTTPAGA